MNVFSRWLESMGQDPRTFLKDAVVFGVRAYAILFVLFLPVTLLSHWLKPAPAVTPTPAAKAPLPPHFWLFAALLFIYLFCVVAIFLALMGGWRKLAGRFPAPRDWKEGRLFKWQSGAVGVVNYNNVWFVRVSSQGLYLACIFPFRLMHPPMLIPWQQVKALRQKRKSSSLTIGFPKLATITLQNPKIVEAAKEWLPQS